MSPLRVEVFNPQKSNLMKLEAGESGSLFCSDPYGGSVSCKFSCNKSDSMINETIKTVEGAETEITKKLEPGESHEVRVRPEISRSLMRVVFTHTVKIIIASLLGFGWEELFAA